jgi:two-component system, OmpR family, response regulator
MRVLIIEDDNSTARYLMRSLSEGGHLIGHAAGGETGLAMPLERIYDVLVLDRRMLALDGLTLCAACARGMPPCGSRC